ncbi:MAG: DUF6636 domain-containing protein [Nocardioides sp.]
MTATVTVSATPDVTDTGPRGAVSGLPIVLRLGNADELHFRSPSGNIDCWIFGPSYGGGAECVPHQKEFPDPPRRACQLDLLPALRVDAAGVTTYGDCRGDVVGVPGDNVLEYGTAARGGSITCGAQPTGVTCLNPDTGHGFTLSRASYTIF